jgi:hypothetical protein
MVDDVVGVFEAGVTDSLVRVPVVTHGQMHGIVTYIYIIKGFE